MKKYITTAILATVLCISLCGCSKLYQPNMRRYREISDYASSHIQEFRQIKDALSGVKPQSYEESVRIKQDASGTLHMEKFLQPPTEREAAILENDDITALFDDNVVDLIKVYEDCLLFACTQYGNPEAYYGVVFCPSGEITDYVFYPDELTYTPYENGVLGVRENYANLFFYVDLGDSFFYFEQRY